MSQCVRKYLTEYWLYIRSLLYNQLKITYFVLTILKQQMLQYRWILVTSNFCASEFQWVFCSSICKSAHWNKMRLISAKKGETTADNDWGSLSCLLNYNIKHYFVRLLLSRWDSWQKILRHFWKIPLKDHQQISYTRNVLMFLKTLKNIC